MPNMPNTNSIQTNLQCTNEKPVNIHKLSTNLICNQCKVLDDIILRFN